MIHSCTMVCRGACFFYSLPHQSGLCTTDVNPVFGSYLRSLMTKLYGGGDQQWSTDLIRRNLKRKVVIETHCMEYYDDKLFHLGSARSEHNYSLLINYIISNLRRFSRF